MDDVCMIFADIIFYEQKSERIVRSLFFKRLTSSDARQESRPYHDACPGRRWHTRPASSHTPSDIVLVRLEHILDKTLHRICTIYLHRETPSYDCLLQPQNIIFLNLWKIFLSDKMIV